MAITRMSSREFNQDASRAKRAAQSGPVIITDRGAPAHVLLSYEEYQRLTGGRRMTDLLALPEGVEAELDISRANDLPRPVDLD